MRDGCAGFFSQQRAGGRQGDRPPGPRPAPHDRHPPGRLAGTGAAWPREAYDAAQLDRLRAGDLAGCFGPLFAGLAAARPLTIPGGRMRLVHRVIELDPHGGRYGLGIIRAEADIHPDDWFLTCHFVDDRVMPGTLMYECCLHTLRIFLLRMGWVAETAGAAWEPVPGVASRLCCRGQVLETTRIVTYEVTIRELGYRPEPYAIVRCPDVRRRQADRRDHQHVGPPDRHDQGTADGALAQLRTRLCPAGARSGDERRSKPAIYTKEQILAYSNGNPSEGFGEPIPDLRQRAQDRPPPRPAVSSSWTGSPPCAGEPWQMAAGAMVEAQYDIPADAWYFAAERQPRMPFAVLLEAALQPCGWLAAYVGSALTSPTDLSFRNLGGSAVQHRPVTPRQRHPDRTADHEEGGHQRRHDHPGVRLHVSRTGWGPVYEGETMFGFFSREALANQVGIRDATPYQPTAEEIGARPSLPYPEARPFPEKKLRMIDRIELFVPDGGPQGSATSAGPRMSIPDEWFFKAHFYQDPVTPGSLGLESFLQLLKFVAVERWGWREGDTVSAVALERRHRWLYRGQIVPTNSRVTVEAWITAVDDEERTPDRRRLPRRGRQADLPDE